MLENNQEFKRWNIERRNVLRVSRDKKSMEATREKMDQIRKEMTSNLGPARERSKEEEKIIIKNNEQITSQNTSPIQQPKSSDTNTTKSNSRDFSSGGGGGPVNPLILLGAIGIYLRRKKK